MAKHKNNSEKPDSCEDDIDYGDVNNIILDGKINAIYSKINNAPSGRDIFEECLKIAESLIRKNISYGDSALNPRPIFSKGGNTESLASRIDDKLNRIANNQSYPGDNDIDDLIGYLVLYSIKIRREKECQPIPLIV